jgi:hypothetical protein
MNQRRAAYQQGPARHLAIERGNTTHHIELYQQSDQAGQVCKHNLQVYAAFNLGEVSFCRRYIVVWQFGTVECLDAFHGLFLFSSRVLLPSCILVP